MAERRPPTRLGCLNRKVAAARMPPSFMPFKGVGQEPGCRNPAVGLGLPGLRSSSGTGQSQGTGASQVAPPDPSSGRLWVLSLLWCLWPHPAQKGSPSIRVGEGKAGTQLRGRGGAAGNGDRSIRELQTLEPLTRASVHHVRQSSALLPTPTPVLRMLKLKF